MSAHLGAPYNLRAALSAVFDETVCIARYASPASTRRFLPVSALPTGTQLQRRVFHNYFVTHLPSSSLAPDKQHAGHHRLPRSESQPHSGRLSRSAAQLPQARDTTIVRIPIRSAKHHFGAGVSRGSRPYNEDTYQAGTIEIPAFAKRRPVSLTHTKAGGTEQGAKSETGDPQVFYFGVFDGHGGAECSEFLRDRLHGYVEEAGLLCGLESSLRGDASVDGDSASSEGGVMGEQDSEDLQKSLVSSWRETVGGYFKRFKPEGFPALQDNSSPADNASIETVLTYAFLKADLDFTAAQASKHSALEASRDSLVDDPVLSDRPINDNDLLFHPERPASQNLARSRPMRPSSSPDLNAPIGGRTRFKGGSTASIALISTPTPTPFWHPASPSTLIVAHVGDTRIILSRTADGKAVPTTTTHHPDSPVEASRLRRYAASFVTDSFGEERMAGLANTRAFGDIGSKRLGVSAEPQITKVQLDPAEYAFMTLISDGVCGHLEDQEIIDIVKEAKTPAEGAEKLVGFAVEVSPDSDNATALVVRLGGWERRLEGGSGSLGTKEQRQYRRDEAMNPRSRRQ